MSERFICDVIFEGWHAQSSLEDALFEAGAEFERLGFDSYDNSIEFYDVPADHRLPDAAQKILRDAGFAIAFVNHVDKWETHYRLDKSTAGWRVSYPHKRGEGEVGIWVEERVPTWPKAWFDSGYAVIKPATSQGKSGVQS